MENLEVNFYKIKVIKDYLLLEDKVPLHFITIVFNDNTEKRIALKSEDFIKFHSLYYKLK